jgi:hypothetical protein
MKNMLLPAVCILLGIAGCGLGVSVGAINKLNSDVVILAQQQALIEKTNQIKELNQDLDSCRLMSRLQIEDLEDEIKKINRDSCEISYGEEISF